jgi:hypothetical protein
MDKTNLMHGSNYSILHSSIAYIGPSLTTYQNLNPGYRVYTTDGSYNKSTYVSTSEEIEHYLVRTI